MARKDRSAWWYAWDYGRFAVICGLMSAAVSQSIEIAAYVAIAALLFVRMLQTIDRLSDAYMDLRQPVYDAATQSWEVRTALKHLRRVEDIAFGDASREASERKGS